MKYASLVLANLLRNKLRTALTGGAIALAVLLVCVLLTMPAGIDAILSRAASDTRISVHNKAGVVYPLPLSFTRKVRHLDGVAAALASTWFGGAYEEAGRVTFPNFAVEAEHFGDVYPDYDVSPEQLDDFKRYRDGAIVGQQTMEKYRWKIGDRITLDSTVWAVKLDLRIVGMVRGQQASPLWLNREYVDQALKAAGRGGLGIASVIWARIEDPNRVNDVMRAIDEMSRNSDYETACETEKSFFSNFLGALQGFVKILLIVTALVALCIVFIAANTASMTVRERTVEIAVLKAIGFPRNLIFGTLVAECLVLSTAAGVIGVALAFGITRVLQVFAAGNPALGPLSSFLLTPGVVAQGLLLSLGVGLVSGIAPALGAARRPVARSLREVF